MTPEQIRHARALLGRPDAAIASIARLIGVSRSTICKYVPELEADGGLLSVNVPEPQLQIRAGPEGQAQLL